MSIPLVQKAEKDDINTSIIAIKRNIERINMLLGLSNSEEIDTSEFVKKSDIVDEVTLDNMQSVTSNAVAKCLSYSTSEVDTGTVWTDGRKIYKKTFIKSNVTLVTSRDTIVFDNIDIDPLNVIFFEASASFVYGGDKSCIGYDYLNPYIRGNTIRVSQNYTGSTINAEIKITAYYVKSN